MLKRADIDALKREFLPATDPPTDDWQPPTEYPESADSERNSIPLNGATGASPNERHQGKPSDIHPFETFDASQWEGVLIEPRRWIAHNRIPVSEPGIMSGDGGTGKTKLALQLAVAIPADLGDWVGGVVDAEGQVIVFSAEEKLKEMHRRTLDIIEHRGLSFRDLRGGLHFICDHDDAVLGSVDRNGIVQPTMSLLRLEKTVAAIRPALVIVENAADVYSGNESDRPNVTRFMRGLLGRLTVPCESTVMLIQHPSVGLSPYRTNAETSPGLALARRGPSLVRVKRNSLNPGKTSRQGKSRIFRSSLR
jgi:RecA-family ATPase